jgi:hypothetical protein
MAAIAVTPILLNDCIIQIGTDSYEAAVSTVRFEPTTNIIRWKGMTPTSTYAHAASPEWSCTVTGAQDLATTGSLQNYLLANAGKKVVAKFKPKKPASGTTQTVTATLIIAAPAIGGDVDTIPTFTVQMGVDGQPTVGVE